MYAARIGRREIIKILKARKDIDLNAQDEDGFTALMHAIYRGHGTCATLLLSNSSIKVNIQNNGGQTALMLAGMYNRYDIVRRLCTLDTEINMQDHGRFHTTPSTGGNTALMYAVREGHTKIVELLLARPNIDINAQDSAGTTALIYAVMMRSNEIVQLLLAQPNISINTQDKSGWTALMFAALSGCNEIVSALLAKDDTINTIDEQGGSALAHAVIQGHTHIVRMLLAKEGIIFNNKTAEGKTLLMLAIQYGHEEIVQIFLNRPNIDINATDCEGCTALMYAAFGTISDIALQEIVRLLLNKPGILIDVENAKGETAFIIAAANSRIVVARMLAVAGANLQGATAFGQRTNNRAVKENINWVLTMLNMFTPAAEQLPVAQPQVLQQVHLEGHAEGILDRLPEFLEMFEPNCITTPLLMAAKFGNLPATRRLLERHALSFIPDHNGNTPLHVAIMYGHEAIALHLIGAGASLNIQNKLSHTPLMLAAQNGNFTICNQLIASGADQKITDAQGRTFKEYLPEHLRASSQIAVQRTTEKVPT